jgi:hypothetical protein
MTAGDDEFVEKIRVLSLDLSDSLQPIYAFLPTLTKCFKFVVQGDFILSTSRESIMENSAWNRMLLDRIPAMFVDAVVLMASLILFFNFIEITLKTIYENKTLIAILATLVLFPS